MLLFTWNTSSTQLLQHFTALPSLWLRYVDDAFCILSNDHINGFHTHLNSICSHIQLTIEKEHNFSPPFLDVLVKRDSRHRSITTHSLLSTTVFSKSTHHQQISLLQRHINQNIRSSLLQKLYSAGLTLTSQIEHRNILNYRKFAFLCD